MRVLLQRNLFAEGNRYRASSNGTEVPDTVVLPAGTKVWDGEEWVDPPEDKAGMKALAQQSSEAVAKEEADAPDEKDLPTRIYDPRFKSPNSPEPIVGSMPPPPPPVEDDEAETPLAPELPPVPPDDGSEGTSLDDDDE